MTDGTIDLRQIVGGVSIDADVTAISANEVRAGLANKPNEARPDWENRLIRSLVIVDTLAIAAAILVSWLLRSTTTSNNLTVLGAQISYALVAALAIPVWLIGLVLGGAYDRTIIGSSPNAYSRVLRVAVVVFTSLCALAFLGKVPLSRALVATAIPALIVFELIGRYAVRKSLHRRRGRGLDMHRLVFVGDRRSVSNLSTHLQRSTHAGYDVVGAYLPGAAERDVTIDVDVPVVGEPDQLLEDLDHLDIDAIAVSGTGLFEHESVRSLAWKLHGTGIQLLMAPDLAEIAGPRIVSRPAAGLPMLLVEEPNTHGVAQACKAFTERAVAILGIIAISPLLAVIALLVKRSGPGPILYRQTRIARDEQPFEMLKFRSMVQDADLQVDELSDENDHDGVLFKIREDPRITRVGRFIRRYSLDELPQLFNVARGDMAIVGPRPPLPSEVSKYRGDTGRRLMVKPGITGLWQVSGRSDLSWEDTVRLDLYYVENWSISLDAVILAKTVKAVITGDGAY